MGPRERDAERRLGAYVLREWTARRLVAERKRAPWILVVVVGVACLLLIVVLAPWRGGARVPVAVSLVVITLAIAALIAVFVPRLERLVVDVEARECRMERVYLPVRQTGEIRIPLGEVRGVRCRQRVWQDTPDAAVVRWAVELVGDSATWPLAEDDQEAPMQELARLVAEVAGIPRHSEST